MTHLSLFSGIGGLDLAAEMAGFRTVGQCEFADYPTKVLEKHWPEVPRWRDVRTLTKEDFYAKTGLRAVDIISGGFPCQPFSVAGKQKAKKDDRYLWPEMLRAIRELAPRWVVAENVPGILRIAAADVVQDLEREGYHVVVFDFEAAAVGAPHRRERVAFVANRPSEGKRSLSIQPRQTRQADTDVDGSSSTVVADSDLARLQGWKRESMPECAGKRTFGACSASKPLVDDPDRVRRCRDARRRQFAQLADGRWWAAEPGVGRVAHGISHRVDRIKALGNAVVPAQFYPIFKAIWEVEHRDRSN